MESGKLEDFINNIWDTSIIPELEEYIKIPAKSPNYDQDWIENGYLKEAGERIHKWCTKSEIKGLKAELLTPEGKTPLLFIEIDGTDPNRDTSVLMYGHIDKQPESTGWDDNKGPWKPVTENNRLYGRGGADDGYSVFMAIASIKALQEQNIPHPHCSLVIESCEESGSFDLDYYFDFLKNRMKTPDLVICLDSGCGNYEQLWLTTSLRGALVGNLSVEILKEGIHSGNSGMVASSFRILRQLLSRIEDENTGNILLDDLHVNIPDSRIEQADKAADILGDDLVNALPLTEGASLVSENKTELILNSTWKPTLSYIAAGGFPEHGQSGNVLRPGTSLTLSFRLPPTIDTKTAKQKIKDVLEANPPYSAKVTFQSNKGGEGWSMKEHPQWLENAVSKSSRIFFGKEPAFIGEGGSIPLMNMLSKKFPEAEFIVTGVIGPHANAHGPNEFLDIPMAKKLTACISFILAEQNK